MACIGSVITLLINWILIPVIGYEGSAWAKLACYFSMMVISYFWGLKYYKIPYDVLKIIIWMAAALGLYLVSAWLRPDGLALRLIFNTFLFGLFILMIAFAEKETVGKLINRLRLRLKG